MEKLFNIKISFDKSIKKLKLDSKELLLEFLSGYYDKILENIYEKGKISKGKLRKIRFMKM